MQNSYPTRIILVSGSILLGIGLSIRLSYPTGKICIPRQDDGTFSFTQDYYGKLLMKIILKPNGSFMQTMWVVPRREWNVTWVAPIDACDVYGVCGQFGNCNPKSSPMCSCLKGYEPVNKSEWDKGNWSGGCARKGALQCDRNSNSSDKNQEDRFSKLLNIKVPDFIEVSQGRLDECYSLCSKNCSCIAYSYDRGISCMFWRDHLIDLYIGVAYSVDDEKRDLKLVIVIPIISGFVAISFCIVVSWMWRAKRKGNMFEHAKFYKPNAYSPSLSCDSFCESGQRKKNGETCRLDSCETVVLRDGINEVSLDELPALRTLQMLQTNSMKAIYSGRVVLGLYTSCEGNSCEGEVDKWQGNSCEEAF